MLFQSEHLHSELRIAVDHVTPLKIKVQAVSFVRLYSWKFHSLTNLREFLRHAVPPLYPRNIQVSVRTLYFHISFHS